MAVLVTLARIGSHEHNNADAGLSKSPSRLKSKNQHALSATFTTARLNTTRRRRLTAATPQTWQSPSLLLRVVAVLGVWLTCLVCSCQAAEKINVNALVNTTTSHASDLLSYHATARLPSVMPSVAPSTAPSTAPSVPSQEKIVPQKTSSSSTSASTSTSTSRNISDSDNPHYTVSPQRHVQPFDLPAFSMLLRVRVDHTAANANQDDDFYDDDGFYLDLEIFQETLEHATQLHLTDVFESFNSQPPELLARASFVRLSLSTKVRQEGGIELVDTTTTSAFLPLHAAFNGVIVYSFLEGVDNNDSDKNQQDKDHNAAIQGAIASMLKEGLTAENYLLLFRRYISTGILANVEDIADIMIGTTSIIHIDDGSSGAVSPTMTLGGTSSTSKQDETAMSGTAATSASEQSTTTQQSPDLNAVTIVAIVIFLTLSCLLMLFGATVVLLMKDRAKEERSLNGQTMTSLGMGANNNKDDDDASAASGARNRHKRTSDDDDGNKDGNDKTVPAWKRIVLPVLKQAVLVRRYWKRNLRKQRRTRRRNKKQQRTDANNTQSNVNVRDNTLAEDYNDDDDQFMDDDGLRDEDIYYDEDLSDEEAANKWLDAWSQSITSIPVRKVKSHSSSSSHSKAKTTSSSPSKHTKKKKIEKSKMTALAPHPAKRQSKKAFLCCIAEEDSVVDGALMEEEEEDEDESNEASSSDDDDLELGGKNHEALDPTNSSCKNTTAPKVEASDRIQELASAIMEEEYPASVPSPEPSQSKTPPPSSSNPAMYGSSARRNKHFIKPVNLLPAPEDDDDYDNVDDVDLT